MRKRLSWDEEKVADIMKKADPYTMNQDRKNPPIEKYETGDPSAWAEDPHMATPWKTEGRTETGHPAPAREAVMAARKLEDKAIKCITIAQRMLPGASDDLVEEQATDLMYLPERSVLSTLQRQANLAEVIAGDNGNDDDDNDDDDEKEMDEEKEAKKEKEDTPAEEKKPKAAEKEDTPAEEKKEEKESGKEMKDEEDEEKEEEAGKDMKDEEKEEEKEAGKEMKDEEKEEEKEAAEAPDLLDKIFEASETKTGAKKLSGLVKQASSEGNLDRIWDAPPDVSSAFK